MSFWQRLTGRGSSSLDLLGFAPTATPTADAWLDTFTNDFMQRPTAAHGADTFMSGLRFYNAAFVAELQALPPVEARHPKLPGVIPRAIYTTAGTIIVAVYTNFISRNAGRGEIRAAFALEMPNLLSKNTYRMH